ASPMYPLTIQGGGFNLAYFKRAPGGGGAGFSLENGNGNVINFGCSALGPIFFTGLNGGADNYLAANTDELRVKSGMKMGFSSSSTNPESAAVDAYLYRNDVNVLRTPGAFLVDGNVGIGTTITGSNKLAVEGTIGARKLKITQITPWPDYVFDSAY
ncbi:hypothetical protein ACI6Q2_23495, partial [Chitinophagaceae bacterium LWZ2-11]